MKKKYADIISLTVLLAIEFGFSFLANDFESFFVIWGVIWLFCLAYNFKTTPSVLRALGSTTDAANYANMSGALAEIESVPDEIRRRPYRPLIFVYAILFILNVIGYIVVVVIKY